MQKVAMHSKIATLRRAAVEFRTRDVLQGSKIDETRNTFQALQLLPRRVQSWNATYSRVATFTPQDVNLERDTFQSGILE
jgi:hypothetical protein